VVAGLAAVQELHFTRNMKNLGLFAFGVTTCVLLPTTVHWLQAGPKQVAKLVAPDAHTLTIGDAKVEVAVDRSFVDAGDKVHVTLKATSPKRQKITLALLAYESTGTGGGRVETPPDKIGRDEVTLDIVDGVATKQVAFTLRGARAQTMEGDDAFGHYMILAMPPKDADRLETLRRRAELGGDPMQDKGGHNARFETAFRSIGEAPSVPDTAPDPDATKPFGTPGQMARLDVNTRSKSSVIAITAPDHAVAGEALAVTVRVTNPAKRALDEVTIILSGTPDAIVSEYLGIDRDHISIVDGERKLAFAAGETKDLVFHVTPTTSGVLGLFATVNCTGEGCYDRGPMLRDSALDAVEIAPAEHPPMVVIQ
jgi:hypothetical protein